MIRLAPVLLMMAAVASGAAADPACLPNCDGENLLGRDLRFANMPDASLRFASLVIANLARADLSGADLSFANLSDVVGWSTVTLEGVRGCDTATEPRPLLPGC